MSPGPLTILQVSTAEQRGGAEQVARNLFDAYRRAGHRSYLVVGRGPSSEPDVIALSERGRRGIAHTLAGVGRIADRFRGVESFRYPASRRVARLAPDSPDVVHAHNLHGGYFDLRVLADLGRDYPVVLTLHDSWLLTGHCSHSFACDRWRTGCGACPDLTIYPAVRRDATAQNWERKREVFARSDLFVATPSEWLMARVRASMLAPAVRGSRVIPNGVDLSIFEPGERRAARAEVGLGPDARVLLFAGNDVRRNPFKDYATARVAAARAAELLGSEVDLVVLGDQGEPEREGRATLRFVPFQGSASRVAGYYRAADLYLHAARADTFPTTVLEAMACGTPVVASAVGGIPEQVRSLTSPTGRAAGLWPAYGANDATGALVTPGDAEQMARVIADLLARHDLVERLGRNAADDARRRFDLARQRDAYLEWYAEVIDQHAALPHRSPDREPATSAASGS